MIHEFAHHRAANHYSEEFHEACCELGAGLKQLAMSQPEKMAEFTDTTTSESSPTTVASVPPSAYSPSEEWANRD